MSDLCFKINFSTDKFVEDPTYQMNKPGVTTSINGKNKTLYMQTVNSIEQATRPNLKKTLKELGKNSSLDQKETVLGILIISKYFSRS